LKNIFAIISSLDEFSEFFQIRRNSQIKRKFFSSHENFRPETFLLRLIMQRIPSKKFEESP